MGTFKEVEGDLIKLALAKKFDVVAHGCNCHCVMGAGIAPQMAKAFGADGFRMEQKHFKGKIEKLGNIDYQRVIVGEDGEVTQVDLDKPFRAEKPLMEALMGKGEGLLWVVNAYTQFNYGANHVDGDAKPVDYAAMELCFKKINHVFKGKHIGLPLIGCGLAGGDWFTVSQLIQTNLKDMDVTIVHYKP